MNCSKFRLHNFKVTIIIVKCQNQAIILFNYFGIIQKHSRYFFHDLKVVSFCAKSTSAIFQFSRCKVSSQWLHGNCLCRDISIDIHILFLASGILLFSCAICFHTKSRLASALAFHTAQLFAFLHILVCDSQNAWTNFNL